MPRMSFFLGVDEPCIIMLLMHNNVLTMLTIVHSLLSAMLVIRDIKLNSMRLRCLWLIIPFAY